MKGIRSPVIPFKNLLGFLILSWIVTVDSPTLGNYHTDIVKCEDDQKQFQSDFNKTCLRIESFSGTLFHYNDPHNINMNCSYRGPVFCYSEKRLQGCIYVEGVNILNETSNFYELFQKFFTCNEISQEQQDCLNLLYYKYLALFYKFHDDSEARCGNSHGWWSYVVAVVVAVVIFLLCCFYKEKFPNFNFRLPKSCNWTIRGKKTETDKPDQSAHLEVADAVLSQELENLNTSSSSQPMATGHEAKFGEDALEQGSPNFSARGPH